MRTATEIIDCRTLAERYWSWIRSRLAELPSPPGIATLLSSERRDPASLKYRDMILKDARALGVRASSVEAEGERAIIEAIAGLNDDPAVHGVVVLYPLGLSRRDDEIMDLVVPRKDVEGLHSINLGYLIKFRRFLNEEMGIKCVVPATAKAVVKALQAYPQVPISGASAVIVNNSMRVGKPLGLMLENLGATVVKCYDQTRRDVLEDCVRRADIVITAVPDLTFKLNPDWIRDGAAVVDVSYTGNVDSTALEGRAAVMTGPDNRIGPLTRALMFVNLIYGCGPQPTMDETRFFNGTPMRSVIE